MNLENLSLLFPWINFLLFVVLIYCVAKKPMMDLAKERHAAMVKSLEEASEAFSVAFADNEDQVRRIEKLDDELEMTMHGLRVDAESDAELLMQQGRTYARSIENNAQYRIQTLMERAQETLKNHISQSLEQDILQELNTLTSEKYSFLQKSQERFLQASHRKGDSL